MPLLEMTCDVCGKPATQFYDPNALTAGSGYLSNGLNMHPRCAEHGFQLQYIASSVDSQQIQSLRETIKRQAAELAALREQRQALVDQLQLSLGDVGRLNHDFSQLEKEQVALREREQRMRAVLAKVAEMETRYDDNSAAMVCPGCGEYVLWEQRNMPVPHSIDCPIAQAHALLADGEAGDGA